MKRWVLYVDGEEPVYFDGDDVAEWRHLGSHEEKLTVKALDVLAVGEGCVVAEGRVQRLDDERMEVCDVLGCYETFATHKGETRCPTHRRTA